MSVYTQSGVREIANITFKAVADTKIGTRQFKKGETVIYFDSAKTSSIEGTANQVYAQGGRGNPRLVSWEGDKAVTFKFEDALISSLGFSILSGADLIDKSTVTVPRRAQLNVTKGSNSKKYLVFPEDGNKEAVRKPSAKTPNMHMFVRELDANGNLTLGKSIEVNLDDASDGGKLSLKLNDKTYSLEDPASLLDENKQYVVDYYVDAQGSTMSIDPGKFAGNFLIEAETLHRRAADGVDLPAVFTIPNGKIQSKFTFSMASSGEPSKFDFTVDALPGYTPYDRTRKVMADLTMLSGEELGSYTDPVGSNPGAAVRARGKGE